MTVAGTVYIETIAFNPGLDYYVYVESKLDSTEKVLTNQIAEFTCTVLSMYI